MLFSLIVLATEDVTISQLIKRLSVGLRKIGNACAKEASIMRDLDN